MPEPFHQALDAALGADPSALGPWLADGQADAVGLAVYRNTVAKGRADALAALYPTVQRLVGPDWFREAALIFGREQPPSSPIMDTSGDGFPDWLARFAPARDLPYLAPVARLDLAWSQAHGAADALVLDTADVAALAPAALFAARAVVHPSVHLFWFEWTVPSIWLANRPGMTGAEPVAWEATPEGLVVLRPGMEVTHHRLDRDRWTFVDASRRGQPLGRIAAQLAIASPGTDLSRLFADLLRLGVFTRLETQGSPS